MILFMEITIDFNHVMFQISPDRLKEKQLILLAARKQDSKTVRQQDSASFEREEQIAKGNEQNISAKVKKSIITVGICMISALKYSEQAGDESLFD